ncbi:MAG: tRNA uridine-5-carboxymethylaminomethyl(34) synthesis enzyme MnmG [Anaerovoracaceae bacterium]|jgi:tRNA uridine 5-carboxymethylaminomethyl modification enzyme
MSEEYLMDEYDIVIVGAGHAGCEAALASARMGKSTLMVAMNLESVAMMPCNPSIGGTGKGHLVREIDALGGEMGVNIDKTMIQMRMLNTAKGPAVHSLRAQADKHLYHLEMKKTIETTPGLDLKQGEITELIVEEGKVCGVKLATHAIYRAKAVVICTGTFLNGRVFIGDSSYSSGPNGLAPSVPLAENLKELGLPLRRFKTGTPARALGKSLDYSKMSEQVGDDPITPFSFLHDRIDIDQISCWLTYTNETTHDIIRNNLDRSALYGGYIEGIGPRYCPSIEDKVNRFKDKKRHQLFVEPEGKTTDEVYLQGMSTSLPEDVQREFYKSIAGLENLKIIRPGYAIEYDCIDPLDLKNSLENRHIENLFCAGQFNGSSGYEEAAAQGLMAGINAVLKISGQNPFVLDRSEAYIGVLIDDLVLKGTNEPYRIMTSRAEYRLVLRNDNADLRLTEKSYRLGLASEERYQRYLEKKRLVEKELKRIEKLMITPEQANKFLESVSSSPLKNKCSLADLIKRPEVTYANSAVLDPERPELPAHVIENIAVRIKYSGYIDKQKAQIEKFKKMEGRLIPQGIDYDSIHGLRLEARQKLSRLQPASLGQASRISGVSPADINVLLIFMEKQKRAANVK